MGQLWRLTLPRFISPIPSEDSDHNVSCVRAKNYALSPVHANNGGNDWDLRLRQHFQGDFNVTASEVRLFVRIHFAPGMKQAATAEHLRVKLCARALSFFDLTESIEEPLSSFADSGQKPCALPP